MRKMNLTVMLLVVLVSFGAFAFAGDNASQYCSANNDFGVDHDTCVTCLNKGQGNWATCICKIYQDYGWLEYAGFKNLGACVSYFKSL